MLYLPNTANLAVRAWEVKCVCVCHHEVNITVYEKCAINTEPKVCAPAYYVIILKEYNIIIIAMYPHLPCPYFILQLTAVRVGCK